MLGIKLSMRLLALHVDRGNRKHSRPPEDAGPAPSTIVAAIGPDTSHGADFVASVLSGCWSAKGLRVVPIETDTLNGGVSSYRLSLLRVESVPGTP